MTAKDFFTNTFNTDFLSSDEKETIIKAMELFAKGKCKEQREICSRLVSGWPNEILTETEMADRIVNAPPPEL